MSDQNKETRTLQDIQNQYTGLCNKAGHLNYQIRTFEKDLELIYSTLRDLNFEAAALQAKDQVAAVEAAKAAATKSDDASLSSVPELPAVKKARKLKEVSNNA
jgi:hypothetical protein